MTKTRKVVVAENMSANGVIEFVEPWFNPAEEEDDQLAVVHGHMAAEDALILGRKTFEAFRSYWPKQENDQTGFTAHLNNVQKYLFSKTIDDPAWQNTTVLRGPIADEVNVLKAQPGGEIGVTGSIEIVHDLMREDLVDEYRLFVYPVLTSRGRNLVPEGMTMGDLKLTDTCAFKSGAVLLTYLRA
jgi:dihydrofolate reductase